VGLIDWLGLARGALWVLGLSIALAAWSYASWWARAHGLPWRTAIGMPSFIIPFFAGLALVSAGLAWGLDRLWMQVLWILVGAWSLWEIARGWRTAGSRKHTMQEERNETH
jgi:hypothetical protein